MSKFLRMTRFLAGLVFLGMTNSVCISQQDIVSAADNQETAERRLKVATVPIGTPLSIQTEDNFPLRVGQAVKGKLVYPVDIGNQIVIPAGTIVTGKITSLRPDKSHRIESRLRADFTPFHKATVNFDQLIFPEGGSAAISTSPASEGAKVFRLVPSPPQKGGVVRRQLSTVVSDAKDRIAVFTGPDKRDRLVQFLYTQLPYHPQRLNKGTSWTVETTVPFTLHAVDAPATAGEKNAENQVRASLSQATSQATPWIVQAYLQEPLSSATSSIGSSVHAIVAEPIFGPDHSVSVPQGAVLQGAITQARPARRFGRSGVLRFDFKELVFPDGGATNHVQTSLKGIDAADGRDLAIDSEGRVKPKPQNKLAVPLILLVLAARPLDQEQGDSALAKDAVASNSLGLIGFVVGTAGGWRNVAAGFGYYGAALSIYNRWIKRGPEITFSKNTRVVVQTAVRESKSLSEANK